MASVKNISTKLDALTIARDSFHQLSGAQKRAIVNQYADEVDSRRRRKKKVVQVARGAKTEVDSKNVVVNVEPKPQRNRRRRKAGPVGRIGALTGSYKQKLFALKVKQREAMRWFFRYVDPCGEKIRGGYRMPDGIAPTTTSCFRKDQWNIAIPNEYPVPEGATGPHPWTLIMVSQPMAYNHTIFLVPHPGDGTSPNPPAASSPNLYEDIAYVLEGAITIAGTSPGSVYPSWALISVPHGTAVYKWYVTRCGSSAYPIPQGSTQGLFQQNWRSLRRTSVGYTCTLNTSHLYDQGRCVAGQFGTAIRLWSALATEGAMPVETAEQGRTEVLSQMVEVPPVLEADVLQTDSSSYFGDARDGVYMVMRANLPKNKPTELSVQYPIRYMYKGVWGYANQSDPLTSTAHAVDHVLEGFKFGVIQWPDILSTSAIRCSRFETIEGEPNAESIIAPFDVEALPDAPEVVALASEFSRTQPSAYPADYNCDDILGQELVAQFGPMADGSDMIVRAGNAGSAKPPAIMPYRNNLMVTSPAGGGIAVPVPYGRRKAQKIERAIGREALASSRLGINLGGGIFGPNWGAGLGLGIDF